MHRRSSQWKRLKPEIKVPAGLFLVRVLLLAASPLPPHMVESASLASSSPDKDTNPAVEVPPLDLI